MNGELDTKRGQGAAPEAANDQFAERSIPAAHTVPSPQQGPDEAPGARAMAALSQAVTAPRAPTPIELEAAPADADEEAEADDNELLAARFCRFDPRDPRLIAALHPGGWMREGGSGPLAALEALADAADALQADQFAARNARRRTRR